MTTLIWPTMAAAQANAARTTVAPLSWDPVGLLLSRAAFGPTPYARTWLQSNGPDAWYQQQLTYAETYKIYAGRPQAAALFPMLTQSPFDTRQSLALAGNQYGWTAMDALTRITLAQQFSSPAQLYEVLVDFFSNHLNVPNHSGDMWITRHCYDRDVIRTHAMGSFTDMLLASSKHPAMLTYLSLADSNKYALNENYGRELLELHTIGRRYTEDDVRNCARALTGRTYDRNYHYVYDDYIHDTDPVTVLGFTSPNSSAANGEVVGDDLVRYLAAHPYTAQRLAQKLCVRLVSDTPSTALVAAVAQAYTDNGTKILPMVSTILRSTEFWESRGRKVRRPAENVIATMRTLNLTVTDWGKALNTMHWMTRWVGQLPLDWAAPNGYPDVATSWRSSGTLLNVWKAHLGFAGGWWDGFAAPDMTALYGGSTPATSGDAITKLTVRLTGQTWSSTHLSALQTMLNEPASTSMSRSVLRWWGSSLAAAIFNSPHFALR